MFYFLSGKTIIIYSGNVKDLESMFSGMVVLEVWFVGLRGPEEWQVGSMFRVTGDWNLG
jgi:hypothetical protein